MKCAPRACAFLFFILHLNTISLITIDKKIVFETLSRCVCSSYPTHKRNENHKPTLVCTQQHIFLRLLTYMQIGTQETVEKNMVCKTSFDAPRSVYPMRIVAICSKTKRRRQKEVSKNSSFKKLCKTTLQT